MDPNSPSNVDDSLIVCVEATIIAEVDANSLACNDVVGALISFDGATSDVLSNNVTDIVDCIVNSVLNERCW